jgi:hypothetical protein
MRRFRFAMQDFDVIPTPGTDSVVVMHYLELGGSTTWTFTPGSNVEQILIQFSEAISNQPRLHTEYLLHNSWYVSKVALYASNFTLNVLRILSAVIRSFLSMAVDQALALSENKPPLIMNSIYEPPSPDMIIHSNTCKLTFV